MIKLHHPRVDQVAINARTVAATVRLTDTGHDAGFPGALCAEIGPELFFIEEGLAASDDDRTAARLCFSCPARIQCLLFALDNRTDSLFGVWGGLRQRQLEWLKRQPVYGPERSTEGE